LFATPGYGKTTSSVAVNVISGLTQMLQEKEAYEQALQQRLSVARSQQSGRVYKELSISNSVIKGVVEFLSTLPPMSPTRWSIVGSMAEYVTAKEVEILAEQLGAQQFFAERTIREAHSKLKNMTNDELAIAMGRVADLERSHYDTSVEDEVQTFWFSSAETLFINRFFHFLLRNPSKLFGKNTNIDSNI
jgi:hypothetical protein